MSIPTPPGIAEAVHRRTRDARCIWYVPLPNDETVYVLALSVEEARDAFDVAGYHLDGLPRRGRRDNPLLKTWDDVTPPMRRWWVSGKSAKGRGLGTAVYAFTAAGARRQVDRRWTHVEVRPIEPAERHALREDA